LNTASPPHAWHILTGEYPPQSGGVADYTRLLALALVRAGDRVHLWIPPASEPPTRTEGATVHVLPDHFGWKSLPGLSRRLRRADPDATLLVQYVPHMYGMRAMNLPLAVWLRRFAPRPRWVMFHEVAFPMDAGRPWKHRLLGIVQHLMAGLVVRGADRSTIAIPRWQAVLRRCAPGCARSTVVPIPSTVALSADADAVVRVRQSLGCGPDSRVIGHFGTWGAAITASLEPVVVEVLGAMPAVSMLAVGRDSDVWYAGFVARYPDLAARIRATGNVSPERVGEYLRACDLLVQPYPDGVSCRRSSAMAGIALGRPVVTDSGPATEPVWRDERLVVAIDRNGESDTRAMVSAVVALLADPLERECLGERAERGYRDLFSIERTLEILRGPFPTSEPR